MDAWENDDEGQIHRITRGMAIAVKRVRAYMEEEKSQSKRRNVMHAVQRTAEATGLSVSEVEKIKEKGVDFFPEDRERETRE